MPLISSNWIGIDPTSLDEMADLSELEDGLTSSISITGGVVLINHLSRRKQSHIPEILVQQ